MLKIKLAKPMLVALAACAASVAFNGIVFADDAQTKALKDQMGHAAADAGAAEEVEA